MALTLVQSANSWGSSVSLTGVAAGNLIIVSQNNNEAGPTTWTCSDGTSSFVSCTAISDGETKVQHFYLLSANAGNKTYTVSGIEDYANSISVYELSYDGALSLDDTANNSGSSTSITSGNLDTTGYAFVIAMAYCAGGDGWSSCQVNGSAADGTNSYYNNGSVGFYSRIEQSFTGAATCTFASSSLYTCSAIAIKEDTTTITRVVDPDMGTGYDYDSLSDWEADLGDTTSGNLPADNEIAVAKCRCTGGTADSDAVTVDGWTTDSTRYIKIWTDPTESYRHAGKWETGNKYRLVASRGCGIGSLNIKEHYVRIVGLQVDNTAADQAVGITMYDCSASTNSRVEIVGNVIRLTGGSGTGGHYGIVYIERVNCYVINNVVYDYEYGIYINYNETAVESCIYNNTVVDCSISGITNYGWGGATQRAYNNIVQGTSSSGNYVQVPYDASGNNISEDTSSPNEAYQQKVVTFLLEGSDDFHLDSTDTVAKGYGTNLYNDASYPFQTDIDGQDRGSTKDSDSFTNTNGTLLNTHNSIWDPAASKNLSEAEIQGNAVVCNIAWGDVFAIYNNGQPANQTSQAVFKATASPKPETRSVIVRASSTTEGYRLKFEDTSGNNYTSLKLNKNGSWAYTFSSSGSWSCLVDHPLRLEVVTVGSDAVLTAFVDGVQVGSAYTDSSSPITSGYPGFHVGADATTSSYAVDSWESAAPWDIGADEYIDSYQLPVNRQYVRGATATWYEVVDVYVLVGDEWVPDKLIRILDDGDWI